MWEKIKIQMCQKDAYVPTSHSELAAGLDLHCRSDLLIKARNRLVHNIGIKIELPMGCYGRLASRSGLAVKQGIEIGAGVIDTDYRGEIHVLIHNHSDTDVSFKAGNRIAQIILERIIYPKVEICNKLTDTARGQDGLGSSGI